MQTTIFNAVITAWLNASIYVDVVLEGTGLRGLKCKTLPQSIGCRPFI